MGSCKFDILAKRILGSDNCIMLWGAEIKDNVLIVSWGVAKTIPLNQRMHKFGCTTETSYSPKSKEYKFDKVALLTLSDPYYLACRAARKRYAVKINQGYKRMEEFEK